jgi:hypothetical protein
MRRMLPPSLRRGFWQDIPAWRHAVLGLLRMTLAEHRGPVIVPMTLVNSAHFQEIIGSLRDDGVQLHHFALLAQPATVVRRLRARSLGREPRTQPWEIDVLTGGSSSFAGRNSESMSTPITRPWPRWQTLSPALRDSGSPPRPTDRCEPGCTGTQQQHAPCAGFPAKNHPRRNPA